MQSNKILRGEEQVNTLDVSLVFPQVANEHCHNIIVSYVGGEQLMTSMKDQLCDIIATSTVDQSTAGRRQYYVLNKILCMLTVTVISYL